MFWIPRQKTLGRPGSSLAQATLAPPPKGTLLPRLKVGNLGVARFMQQGSTKSFVHIHSAQVLESLVADLCGVESRIPGCIGKGRNLCNRSSGSVLKRLPGDAQEKLPFLRKRSFGGPTREVQRIVGSPN